ncbi:MAG TPA: response regulator transcription factor [Pyrinomonadaceae bacterium]|nr:response regulator transcription factor [Pyrinomonadaceae bacterium]
MSEKQKILVVDDESQIIRVMRHILTAHGYTVRTAEDGESALALFDEWQPDLIITDLQMPNIDGLELSRRIRSLSEVPIIILSVRDEEKTIVEALDAGADDYITKPFGTDELVARVRSVLRRSPAKIETVIELGDFLIDVSSHVAAVRGNDVRLTPKEFELLTFLARNPGKVLTHSLLLKNVWGSYYSEQPEALRVLVGSLRKKIELDPSKPKYLLTEPWIGYRFSPTSDPL